MNDEANEYYLPRGVVGDSYLPDRDRDEWTEFDVWLMAALRDASTYHLLHFENDLKRMSAERVHEMVLGLVENALKSIADRPEAPDATSPNFVLELPKADEGDDD